MDAPNGFPEAINDVFPRDTDSEIQICIVHLLRKLDGDACWTDRNRWQLPSRPPRCEVSGRYSWLKGCPFGDIR